MSSVVHVCRASVLYTKEDGSQPNENLNTNHRHTRTVSHKFSIRCLLYTTQVWPTGEIVKVESNVKL